ncbi:MAG: DMT family transporter [Methanobrevibacter sp.]|jgi:drug/metabolite transporter (DMT)-like permease|nr:DMT family transporter [Candidatus Methanovirga meridionalis]
MKHFLAYLCAMIVALCYGSVPTVDKFLLVSINPLVLSAMVYTSAGIIFLFIHSSPLNNHILSFLHKGRKVDEDMTWRNYLTIFLSSIFASIIAPILYLNGLNLTTAVNAAFLSNTEDLFIILMGVFLLKEIIKLKDVVGFICLLLGALFLSVGNSNDINFNQYLIGNIIVFGSYFFWSLDVILAKFLSNKKNIFLISGLRCAIGGVILIIICFNLGLNFNLSLNSIPPLFFIRVLMMISIIFIYIGIREIGATKMGAILSTSPLLGVLVAIIALNESLNLIQILCGGLMFIGLLILYMDKKNNNEKDIVDA